MGRALLFLAAVGLVAVSLVTLSGCRSTSPDARDGVLIIPLAGLNDYPMGITVEINRKVVFDGSQVERDQPLFIPTTLSEPGWLQIRQMNSPEAVHLKEKVYLFPIGEDDRHGQWRIELREIAHVQKLGPFDQRSRRRETLETIEPPEYGVMVTNKSTAAVREVIVRHPAGDLVASGGDLKPDWGSFVYWGVSMKGIEKLPVTVEMANGAETVTGFTGLSSADEDARWWPRRWEVIVLRGPSGAVFLKR